MGGGFSPPGLEGVDAARIRDKIDRRRRTLATVARTGEPTDELEAELAELHRQLAALTVGGAAAPPWS